MRKITLWQSLVFGALVVLSAGLAGLLVASAAWLLGLDPSLSAGWVTAFALAFMGALLVIYRAFIRLNPLQDGPIAPGSRAEFGYHVYLLFYLVFFQTFTRSLFVPVPVMRLLYQALGCRMGVNTYSAGTILDPPLTHIGDDTIVGHDALIFSHVVEGPNLSLAAVRIGHGVTIGAKAVVMPGVEIGDGAIVGVGAVIRKHSKLGPYEVWAGNPAVRVRTLDPPADGGLRTS